MKHVINYLPADKSYIFFIVFNSLLFYQNSPKYVSKYEYYEFD